MSFGTIYTHNPNPRTTAILAIAKAHGLNLDVIYADKDKNPEDYQELLKINPLGQVPVFAGADGYVLTECIAITLYITSQSETSTLGLLGANKREYYSILKWMSLINSEMLPAIGGVILPLMGRKLDVRLDRDDCLRVFYRDCQVLEDHLQKHRYLVGDKITLADYFAVGMIVFSVMVFHMVLKEKYPRLMDWFIEVYEMPLFKEVAGPLHLLDIPIPGASD
ncbi:glutathione S-transferase [Rhypophila decipiens]|uniref:Glutathione S-transferase n=1 Tax=Rhypophila decipiens TaxID=261697 RepID=A0AAN6XXJ9_9PEZI|nr:glutathione S-transferase [Rhypophila decipiens]